jgi:hypothetical protein
MGSMEMSQRPALAFDRSLLRRGVGLMAVGTTLFLIGTTLGGAALLGACRRYLNQIDERPTDLARRQWQQLRGSIAVVPKADLADLHGTSNPIRGAHAANSTR